MTAHAKRRRVDAPRAAGPAGLHRARAVGWVLLGSLPLSVVVGLAPAAADAPLAVGWWNLGHQGVAPPAPPDVGPTDLLVQGGPRPSAVTALRFTVADGASVGPLVLPLAAGSAPPRAEAVVACPTTKAWQPAANGPWAAAPTWSCERSSAAVLSADGSSLVVADIVRLLAEDGTLSFALVPGSSDRVVLAAPPTTALQVAPAAPPPAAPPPAQEQPAPAPQPAPVPPAVAGPPSFSSGISPLGPVAAAVVVQPPQVGPAPPPVPVAPAVADDVGTAATTVAARPTADDGRTRLVLLANALLLLAFFGLLGAGPFGRLAPLTGQPVLLPDRPRGVGRFAAARTGRPPAL